jgi:hypothetical protein
MTQNLQSAGRCFELALICQSEKVNPSNYINPYPANVENTVSYNNASRWQIGFNSAFKGLNSDVRMHLIESLVDKIL